MERQINNTSETQGKKVSFFQKTAWGMGGMADTIMVNTLITLALPIYNIALGVSPVLISLAIGIPRIWDAFTDPLMGNISDNTRCRFGRRRPYIALGTILTSLIFIIIWFPPASLSEIGLFAYFLTFSLLFYTAYTIFSVPCVALGYELSKDYNERTRIMAHRAFYASVGGAVFVPWAYKLCFYSKFGNNEVEGVRIVAIIFAAFMIIFGLIPAVFCREKVSVQSQNKISMKEALKATFGNKTFLRLLAIMFVILVAIFIMNPLAMYLNIYYVCQGDKAFAATVGGFTGTVYGVLGMLSVPLIAYLATRWDKKKIFIFGQSLVIISALCSWFLFTPKYPYLQLVYAVIACPGLSCHWVLGPSILADICDVDELKTGLRREGMYSAVLSWVFKAGFACVMILSGFVIKWSGVDPELGANQKPESILYLRVLYLLIPVVLLSIACYMTLKLPISKKRALEVRAILDERKSE